jgi:hypothetical protein
VRCRRAARVDGWLDLNPKWPAAPGLGTFEMDCPPALAGALGAVRHKTHFNVFTHDRTLWPSLKLTTCPCLTHCTGGVQRGAVLRIETGTRVGGAEPSSSGKTSLCTAVSGAGNGQAAERVVIDEGVDVGNWTGMVWPTCERERVGISCSRAFTCCQLDGGQRGPTTANGKRRLPEQAHLF